VYLNILKNSAVNHFYFSFE